MQFNKILKISFCAVISAFLTNTYANTNLSTGVFASLNTFPIGLSGTLGYQFTPHFGLQADALGAISGGAGFDFDNVSIYDIAIRGVMPLATRAELFAQLGVGVVSASETFNLPSVPQFTINAQSVGPTYGLGFGYCFTKHWMLSILGFGIYSTDSQVIKSGFKTIPMIGLTYHFA